MRKWAFVAALGWMTGVSAMAAEPAATMNLWPGKPPGDTTDVGPEKTTGTMLANVSTPTLAVYRPAKDKDTGAAVVVCPGGGYTALAMEHEGTNVAEWLASNGVTGVLLKYRVPNRPGMPRYMAGFQDGQRAMNIVRSKAAEWGIDPKRIGMIGFSAGGQVAADVETNFDKLAYDPVDDMDKAGTRPDFVLLVYPGGLTRRGGEVGVLSAQEVKVTKDTPPTFLCIAHKDSNGSENAVYMYLALKKAGVSAELHVYADGGHGFGIRSTDKGPHAAWTVRAMEWMAQSGFLKPGSPTADKKPGDGGK